MFRFKVEVIVNRESEGYLIPIQSDENETLLPCTIGNEPWYFSDTRLAKVLRWAIDNGLAGSLKITTH